ncbi:MAG TPA: shikimate kinase [Pyrinomonadaceae bacterium]|nr:shikimate kinase [Pyrinomonadaceae bacterium]
MSARDSQRRARAERRVVITGFMAAGKTSVAHALARLLGCEAVDLDAVISEHEGRSIGELIDDRGEKMFREIETRTLRGVLENESARVIALGGGAWTFEANRDLIAEHNCLTVWLDASFDLCWRRIERERGTRPLAPERASAHKLFRERRPLYELAALRVEVGEELTADETAAEVLNAMRRRKLLED